MAPPDAAGGETGRWPFALALGVLLVGLAASSTLLWRALERGGIAAEPGLMAVVAVHVAAGGAFLAGVALLRAAPPGRRWLVLVIVVGAGMRLAALPPATGWEDDHYRYRWDGAVTAAGMSPYRYSPLEVQEAGKAGARRSDRASEVPELLELARRQGGEAVLAGTNHPHLRTIYPPLAQVWFAAAHRIEPFSLAALRGVIALHDLAALALLLWLLHALGRPLLLAGVYWANPLVVKELYQSVKMDALVLPLVIAALLAVVYRRSVLAALALAAAVAVKLWPALLAPLVLRGPALPGRPAQGAARALARQALRPELLVFVFAVAALLWPMRGALFGADAGLHAYAASWQNNAGFYALHHAAWERLLPALDVPLWRSQQVTRWATALLVIAAVAVLARRPVADPLDLCRRCLWAVAVLYLVGPTQFPWYYLWLVPLLAVAPSPALLLYTALLPLYHLQGLAPWAPWMQHGPVWVLLGWELVARGRRGTAATAALPAAHPQPAGARPIGDRPWMR